MWDGESLVLPSDSGSLIWWSVSGSQLFEVHAGPGDYTVCLQWSVSGEGLWQCGFSTLSYLEVVRDDAGEWSARWAEHSRNVFGGSIYNLIYSVS